LVFGLDAPERFCEPELADRVSRTKDTPVSARLLLIAESGFTGDTEFEKTGAAMNNFASAGGGVFDQFDVWMDQQLENLVAKWQHAAAPSAQNATFKRGAWSMSPRTPK
jgi:hypothetical protein